MARTSEGMQVVRLRMTVWWPLIFLALMQVPEHTNGQSKYIMVTLLASMCSSVEAFLTHRSSCGLSVLSVLSVSFDFVCNGNG